MPESSQAGYEAARHRGRRPPRRRSAPRRRPGRRRAPGWRPCRRARSGTPGRGRSRRDPGRGRPITTRSMLALPSTDDAGSCTGPRRAAGEFVDRHAVEAGQAAGDAVTQRLRPLVGQRGCPGQRAADGTDGRSRRVGVPSAGNRRGRQQSESPRASTRARTRSAPRCSARAPSAGRRRPRATRRARRPARGRTCPVAEPNRTRGGQATAGRHHRAAAGQGVSTSSATTAAELSERRNIAP